MKSYEQIFTLEINQSREEIINKLSAQDNVKLSGDTITISQKPAWYKIFAPRGLVILTGAIENKSSLQCVIRPAIADWKTIITFLLINIPLWAILLWLLPWNIALAAVFIIEWLMMAFIAIPVLFTGVVIISAYLIYISLSWQSVFFIAISWAFFFLIVNATLRYNRGELKRWIIRRLSR